MHDDAVARARSRFRSRTTTLFVGVGLVTGLTGGVAAPDAKPRVVAVTARDFAFEMPASIPAGLTTFRLANKGKQLHHMTIVRLDDGKTASEGLQAFIAVGRGLRPEWMHGVGGPNAAGPGSTQETTLVLEPGNYLAVCEVPGPDPAPHFMKGMAKAFTVTGPARAATLPRADVAISLTDYDFTFSHALSKGRHAIAVTNNSAQPHMLAIQRLHPGTGVKDFLGWSRDPKGQPAPATGMGGTTEIAPGATVIVTGTFPPGRYAAICFTPDHGDGKPHFQHGMQKEFEVK